MDDDIIIIIIIIIIITTTTMTYHQISPQLLWLHPRVSHHPTSTTLPLTTWFVNPLIPGVVVVVVVVVGVAIMRAYKKASFPGIPSHAYTVLVVNKGHDGDDNKNSSNTIV